MTTIRRSDQVRAKRQHRPQRQSSKPRREKKRGSSANRGMPPMVTRRGVFNPKALTQNKTYAPKKRIHFIMRATGAEIRTPGIPTIRFGWRLLSSALFVLTIWAIAFMWSAPTFRVQTIEINGLQRLSSDQINNHLGLIGQQIFTIDPEFVLTSLEENYPALSDISVEILFPNRIVIQAGELQPLIEWEQDDIRAIWWIDGNGMAFAPLVEDSSLIRIFAQAAPPALPSDVSESEDTNVTASAQSPWLLLTPQTVSQIVTLVDYLPAETVLIYDQLLGFGWQDAEHGWYVFFGHSLDHLAMRWAIYETTIEEVRSITPQPQLVSVAQLHAPYYRFEYNH